MQNDAKELSILYHRLIELNKLGSAQVSTLGDPYDPEEGTLIALPIIKTTDCKNISMTYIVVNLTKTNDKSNRKHNRIFSIS